MNSESYRSTGTIRVRSKFGRTTKIFFTPNADSTACDRGKQYAVFIGDDKDSTCLIRELPDSGEGVTIKVKADPPGLVGAAAKRILVEVEVKKRKSNLVLRAITIPALDK